MAFVDELQRHGDASPSAPEMRRTGRTSGRTSTQRCPRRRTPGVLLRTRRAADRGRGSVQNLASGQPAHRAVLGQSARGTVAWRAGVLRTGMPALRPDFDGAAETKSVYQVCEDAGVDVLGSCMEGVCGTCECDVLEGEPDHRDSVLNDAEKARNDS